MSPHILLKETTLEDKLWRQHRQPHLSIYLVEGLNNLEGCWCERANFGGRSTLLGLLCLCLFGCPAQGHLCCDKRYEGLNGAGSGNCAGTSRKERGEGRKGTRGAAGQDQDWRRVSAA